MKQRFLRKMIAVVGCIWMALLGTNMDVAAQVTATEEVTGPADCIYVAGNPDLFPVEYYSEESKMYEGVMPEIFEIISEKTGRDFVYVSAGKKNQQKELAKNLQVELVSAYMPEEAAVKLMDVFTEEELVVYKRGRNTRSHTMAKNAD